MGEEGMSYCLAGTEFQFCNMKSVLEVHNQVDILSTIELYT